ncbi:MAG: CvpA family protein [Oscillospiraceae bacterium]|nr:CvpA family protein [Oscillospiraceae bacterium]MBR6738298.1 CvpA family protein [Oscillospiraceae bacterium]
MDTIPYVDLLLAAALAFFVFLGAKRGLFKSLTGLLVLIAAIVGAVILASYAAEPLGAVLYPMVEEHFIEMIPLPEEIDLAGSELLATAGAVADKLAQFGLDLSVLGDFLAETDGAAIVSAAAETLFLSVLQGILTVIFFILLLVALKLLVGTFNLVFKLPLLHFVNTLGGALFGLIEGGLFLFLAIFILQKCGVSLSPYAEGSVVLSFFLSHTPQTLLFTLLQQRN